MSDPTPASVETSAGTLQAASQLPAGRAAEVTSLAHVPFIDGMHAAALFGGAVNDLTVVAVHRLAR